MKKIGIIITMILIVCVSIFTINVFNSKDNKVIKDDLGNTLAIMISNDNGIGYKDYEKSTWPSKEYRFKEAKCYDMNGKAVENVVTFNEETRKATITTNQTVSCTLYFDKPIITYLRSNDPSGTLSSELTGGMYRYQGVGVEEAVDETHKYVDNNYICFGTNDESKCNCNTEENCDKYMYRIIGITEDDELYLIKMKGIKEGETNTFTFQWNSLYYSEVCEGDKCDWPNANLYKRLNGNSSNGNPLFINNSRYNYMLDGNDWYKKIEKHSWLYGDVDYSISSTLLNSETVYGVRNNGLILYDIEVGLKPTRTYSYSKKEYLREQWSKEKSIDAKIGLMYLHDYYLAYDNERNWYSDYDKTNWLFINNSNNTLEKSFEWLMTRYKEDAGGGYHPWYVGSDGCIGNLNVLSTANVVRPVFYLTNTIHLSGKGKIDNPYIIN